MTVINCSLDDRARYIHGGVAFNLVFQRLSHFICYFHFKILYGGGPFSRGAGFRGSLHLNYNINNDKEKLKI